MILLITGTRHEHCTEAIEQAVQHLLASDPAFAVLFPGGGLVVHGGAKGMDQAAQHWAILHGWTTQVIAADWDKHGKAAGPIRNRNMAEYCLACNTPTFVLAFPHATLESKGTRGMIEICRKLGLPVTEFPVPSLPK